MTNNNANTIVEVFFLDKMKAMNAFQESMPMLSFQIKPQNVAELDKAGLYFKAAEITIPAEKAAVNPLSYAYEATQNLDRSWTESEGVVVKTTRTRSSDVGDVIVIDGKAHMVAGMGFTELEDFSGLKKSPTRKHEDSGYGLS